MLQYSPLCDTNVFAYLAYLVSSRDGSSVEWVGDKCVIAGGRECNSGGGDDGGDVVGILAGLCRAARVETLGFDGSGVDRRCIGGIDSDVVFDSVKGARGNVGMADSHVGIVGRSLDDSVCFGGVQRGVAGGSQSIGEESKFLSDGSLLSKLEVDTDKGSCGESVVSVGGTKYCSKLERNRAGRRKKKIRKLRRQSREVDNDCADVPEWRRAAPNVSFSGDSRTAVGSDGRGFFSGCSEEIRSKLRDSRARALIAENERKAAVEKRRLDDMSSPAALAREVMKMVNFAGSCQKKEQGSVVAGWAKTVASDYAESIARSCPGTVASLDSIGEVTLESVAEEKKKKQISSVWC